MNRIKQKEIISVTSIASVALSLLSLKAGTVKAAKISNSEQIKIRQVGSINKTRKVKSKKSKNSNKKQESAANTAAGEIEQTEQHNQVVQTAKSDSFERQSNEDVSNQSVDNQVAITTSSQSSKNLASAETETDNHSTYQWMGLNLSVDEDTEGNKVLTIPGSSKPIENPDSLNSIDEYDSINKIIISGPLELTGSVNLLFEGFENLTNIEGLDKLNTSKVINMVSMFSGCEKLNELDLSHFVTNNVDDMNQMFFNCTSLKELDLSSFNTDNVGNMYSMFDGCEQLERIDLSSFNTIIKIPGISYLFRDCYNLQEMRLGPNMATLNDTYLHTDWDDFSDKEWINIGTNPKLPRGTNKWTAGDLMSDYTGDRDYDTYIILAEPVTVHYQDTAGNKVAEDKVIDNYGLGEHLAIKPKSILGYVPNSVKVDNAEKNNLTEANIMFDDAPHEVIFVYKEKPQEEKHEENEEIKQEIKQQEDLKPAEVTQIIVHYEDTAGNTIEQAKVLVGNVGDSYLTVAKNIAGYALQATPANATGIFGNQPQVVTYVYVQNSSNPKEINQSIHTQPTSIIKKPHQVKKPSKQIVTKKTGTNAVVKSTKKTVPLTKPNNQSPRLPQTGEKYQSKLAMFAVGILSLLMSLFGMKCKKKE